MGVRRSAPNVGERRRHSGSFAVVEIPEVQRQQHRGDQQQKPAHHSSALIAPPKLVVVALRTRAERTSLLVQ
eukprot:CAMPEP_0194757424 /NCGR_PEP_ID=MMETSP0323_2-20130528/10921_1 /TAXON_ID=2866 ORGANISM="Crypthecodinium cohnii, Strain Seligo" /NCGR_SAMPLE_ID=MMETSP0323_2 /ASSEMBLY_ACC=CAM_ASM_000346 /LENGTH=71 /DNA_ID=CAMNT_0039677349 /DNA_START=108 /DNA_END=323 /DNA_ORIENTATION=-